MSFSDSLENDLKNLEKSEERDPAAVIRLRGQQQSERARALAAQPYVEKLRKSKFTSELMKHVTRIGHTMRTKVRIVWLGNTLRLEAREHRLELAPTPEGIVATTFHENAQTARNKVDLSGNPEKLARQWLDTVGPPPPPEPIPEEL